MRFVSKRVINRVFFDLLDPTYHPLRKKDLKKRANCSYLVPLILGLLSMYIFAERPKERDPNDICQAMEFFSYVAINLNEPKN